MNALRDLEAAQPAAAGMRAALAGGRLAHAYIVTGADAAGRLAFADAVAKAVVCTDRDDDACGACHACALAAAGNHPDISRWSADGATFKLAQALDLQGRAHVRPLAARRKVFILEDAGVMTAEASNALLKLLEEPPGDALFLLLAPSARTLLPTIVSRAQPLTLHGSAIHASAEAEDGAWELLSRLHALDEAGVMQLAEAWDRDKGLARERVQVLFELWRDALALALGCPPELLYRPDWAPRLQSVAAGADVSWLVNGLAQIGLRQRQLEQNANVRLCLEVLFASLLPAM